MSQNRVLFLHIDPVEWKSPVNVILLFFQDVSDPEYAQVQDALKKKLNISDKPRPTIYAVAIVEEPNPSDKKPKLHAKVTLKSSLRLSHSAEDVSTIERKSRRGKWWLVYVGDYTKAVNNFRRHLCSMWGGGEFDSSPFFMCLPSQNKITREVSALAR